MCGGAAPHCTDPPAGGSSGSSPVHYPDLRAYIITHLKVVRLLSVRDCGALRTTSRGGRELVNSMVETMQVGGSRRVLGQE